ncbi:hypothetical protein [Limisphaera sp. 4302-co]|uniref:hypothetical protein n=1 Tax=Limisphaera sp. 4302-co TaxID=3400417 RepID=UPI003C26B9B5
MTALTGTLPTRVSEVPNGTLIRARVFNAQPLASSKGPRFRFRSFNQASTTYGPETTIIKAASATHTFQNGSFTNPVM